MGGKNQTSTTQSNQTYTPTGAAQLNDIWNQVQQVSSTPYTPYGGQLTAGLSPTQQTAIGNLTGPNYQTAVNYAQNGAQSIDPSQIEKYENPYTQSVINATQNQFNNSNAQQQQQVTGNAALQGALGGDRVGVAKAQLAGQQNLAQAPVIAGLNSQNYTQALQAAQADRAAQASGAQNLSNVSTQGALAQLGAGGVEQQTNQAGLSAQYQQYLQALAFPYQNAQFLTQNGLPTVTAMGGTTNGQSQTTAPGPSPFGQAAGLGLTAASLFLKRGGRVKGYASGGSPMGAENFILVPSYIPQSSNAPHAASAPQMGAITPSKFNTQQATAMPSAQTISGAADGLKGLFGSFGGTDSGTVGGTNPFEGGSSSAIYARGGAVGPHDDFVRTVHSIRRALKDGGAVSPSPFGVQGYDIGGTVDLPLSFADRSMPIQEAIANGTFDPQGMNNTPFTQAPEFTPSPIAGNVPLPAARPDAAPQMVADADVPQSPMAATRSGLPPQVANQDNPIMVPPNADTPDAMAQDDGSTLDLSAQSKQAPQSGGPLSRALGLNISPEAKAGLMSAGLGMLASRSPFALQAIGEGGLQGVKAYTDTKEKAADRDLQAKKLAQSASQFAQTYGLHKQTADEAAEYHKGLLEKQRTPSGYAKNPDGTLSPIKGGPADPDIIQSITKAKQGAPMPEETADFLAERVLNGDNRALVGLGRGAQGAENLTKIQTLVAKKAADRGMNPQDILEKVAEASGLNAQQRTFGTQTAKMAVNATEAQGAIELGRKASEGVPRGNWVPVNRVIQAYQSGTSDPALAKFGAANLAIVNTYARAINPTGVPHAADKEHAMALLSTATGPAAYNALLDQLNAEINIAHSAAPKAKQELEDIRKGKTPQPSATPTTALPARVRQNGHTYERQSDGSMKAID